VRCGDAEMGAPYIGLGRQWRGREMSGRRLRGVEINFVHYKAEKMGGESTGWLVDEGKQRSCEAARLHSLRRVVRGHGTVVARL
jgi:hypothetical protein